MNRFYGIPEAVSLAASPLFISSIRFTLHERGGLSAESFPGRDNIRVQTKALGSIGILDKGSGINLVLLHGWNAHSGTWSRISGLLTSRFRIIAPSFPPHFGPFEETPVKQYTDALEELLSALDVTRAIVTGHSLGGLIALNYLRRKPEVVGAIVLEDTAGFDAEDGLITSGMEYADFISEQGVRTLIIWGEDDPIIPACVGKSIHSAISGSSYFELPGAGHVPHWRKPEAFANLLIGFVSSL